ncbi:RNA polymerase sigma factor SigX [Lederbergia citrea]|uniref:RNA polymerase sigma factor n=1 Tax=Lederbergia citrea TaxID=2833581 RepID=A0A942USU0_9BACI|nr:RNA polymerase sigma factor SigX [Lederbergia citrea]MBS4176473.1 RNA polymerase sigma factor SigX [Lederbergia citrea]MBS4203034.1 RNA polymerase sigma factor SigX [Lederbergia citrea]MBS4222294.1 RNA polymerase sigma factor SigX [Lederbergia citrea]
MNSVFHDIYSKYHQDLFQFLFYMVKNREEAEDLVQEVYIRVMRSYVKFEGKSSEKTWLFSIAKNVAIDHFRKHKSWKERLYEKFDWDRHQVKDLAPLPEETALKNEDIKILYECLDLCNTNYRIILILRYINGLTIAEAAEALNWTESKVKTTQHRALKSLREVMESRLEKEEDNHASI